MGMSDDLLALDREIAIRLFAWSDACPGPTRHEYRDRWGSHWEEGYSCKRCGMWFSISDEEIASDPRFLDEDGEISYDRYAVPHNGLPPPRYTQDDSLTHRVINAMTERGGRFLLRQAPDGATWSVSLSTGTDAPIMVNGAFGEAVCRAALAGRQ